MAFRIKAVSISKMVFIHMYVINIFRLYIFLATGIISAILFSHCQSSSPSGERLFTLLDSTQTNVTFENTVKDVIEHNILIYENYYNGGGVGLGDFNEDGLLDIYFTGNLVGDQLYLNQGDMEFEDITQKAGIKNNGGWSSGVTIADINADGLPDIYVCRDLYDNKVDLRKNKLYINQGVSGDGYPSFKEMSEPYGLDDNQRSRHATFFDYDKDGDLDMYLLNQPPNPGNFSDIYYINTEDTLYSARLYRQEQVKDKDHPVFTDVTGEAGLLNAGYALGVGVADFNKNGWPDIYVANDFDAPDFFYRNNGDGTFTNVIDESMKHISNSSMGVDVGDINNDGFLDIKVLDMVAEGNYRKKAMLGAMKPDEFRQVVNEGGHYQYMYNTLQVNNGNGSYSEIAQMTGTSNTDWSWAPLLADFNNDGHKDLYVTNGFKRDIRNKDVSEEFPAYIDSLVNKTVQENPNAGDIDFWDIVDLDDALGTIPSVKIHNYIFENNGHYSFSKRVEEWGMEKKSFSNGAAYGDLDNDGDIDLVVNNINDPAFIYKNNGQKIKDNHYLRINLKSNPGQISPLNAKIKIYYNDKTQYQEHTNVRGFYSTSEPTIHFGLGKHDNIDKVKVTWMNGRVTIRENIEANQEITIDHQNALENTPDPDTTKEKSRPFQTLKDNWGINYKHEENKYDDFEKKQYLLPHKLSTLGPGIAKGDPNNDGNEDFFIGGAAGATGQLYLQTNEGNFASVSIPALEADKEQEDLSAVFFDADNDQYQDLYVVSGGNEYEAGSPKYQDRLYINTGVNAEGVPQYQKSEEALPEIITSGSCVIPYDYDQDGDVDLFIGSRHVPGFYPHPASSYLLENQGGKFTDVTEKVIPGLKELGMVTDAVWADFNGDDIRDLVVVGEWMPVTFFLNKGNNKFENVTQTYGLQNNAGWWFSIEAADMDQDGDTDFIAGNMGLNFKLNRLKGEEHPLPVYYDDFDNNGSRDIVLGYYQNDTLFPVRDRYFSSAQIASIRQKYPNNKAFAQASLQDIYGENKLENAMKLETNTFASSYIENKGNGEFEFKALPGRAQFSPVNDILVRDFDQDGNPDIVLAGNMYSLEVRTPRADAGTGLYLKGDGKGNFHPVPVTESGFFAPKNVKDLALVNSVKGTLILVANNDDYLDAILMDHKLSQEKQELASQ